MKPFVIVASTLLTGCVGTFARFYSEIPQYKGRKIDALVDRLGYADSQTFVAGRVVYIWTTASTVQVNSWPNPGGPAPPVALLPPQYFEGRSEPESTSLHFRCPLQVDTDGTGTILSLSWVGKSGSCAP